MVIYNPPPLPEGNLSLPILSNCEYCGRQFGASHIDTRFCCQRCSSASYYAKKKGLEPVAPQLRKIIAKEGVIVPPSPVINIVKDVAKNVNAVKAAIPVQPTEKLMTEAQWLLKYEKAQLQREHEIIERNKAERRKEDEKQRVVERQKRINEIENSIPYPEFAKKDKGQWQQRELRIEEYVDLGLTYTQEQLEKFINGRGKPKQ